MTVKDLNKRSLEIFTSLVDAYIESGEPIGSRTLSKRLDDTLSPATIRNIMADLEEAGFLFSPHTSAGRMPTSQGLHFFVESVLEETENDQAQKTALKQQCKISGKNFEEVIRNASDILSGLSKCASIVFTSKFERITIKHIEFLALSDQKGLAIFVSDCGAVENRLFKIPPNVTGYQLTQASNYINHHLQGKTLSAAKNTILKKMQDNQSEFDELTKKVVQQGLAMWAGDGEKSSLIIKGQAHLLENISDIDDIEKIRHLFTELDTQETIRDLLSASITAEGVKIFLGSEHQLFDKSGCSMVVSPYKTDEKIIGAIGVIGPSFMNYRRIIPMINYSAKLISKLMG